MLNLGITIGSILLPPLNAIIGVVNPIINGFAALCETFPRISGVIVGAVAAFGSFIVASAGLGFVLNLVHLNILKALPYFSLFKNAIIGSVAWLKAKNLGLLLVKARLGATMVATKLYGIATIGVSKAIALSGMALKVFGSVLSFIGKSILLNPIFLIGALLAGGAYLIYKHWTPIKELFSVLLDKIKVGASVAWEGLKTLFKWSPLGLIIQGFSAVTEYFTSLFANWVSMFSEVINKIGSTISSIKGFFGFGEKESSIKAQDSLALQPATMNPIEIKPIPQNPKAQAQNINVAFTGGINVQTTDGKIPENSQLQIYRQPKTIAIPTTTLANINMFMHNINIFNILGDLNNLNPASPTAYLNFPKREFHPEYEG